MYMLICRAQTDKRPKGWLCEKVQKSGTHSLLLLFHWFIGNLAYFTQDQTRLPVAWVASLRNFDIISTKRSIGCVVYNNHSHITHL